MKKLVTFLGQSSYAADTPDRDLVLSDLLTTKAVQMLPDLSLSRLVPRVQGVRFDPILEVPERHAGALQADLAHLEVYVDPGFLSDFVRPVARVVRDLDSGAIERVEFVDAVDTLAVFDAWAVDGYPIQWWKQRNAA